MYYLSFEQDLQQVNRDPQVRLAVQDAYNCDMNPQRYPAGRSAAH